MWRFLAESVVGTSHRQARTSCQDSHLCVTRRAGGADYLIAACSDGAGSASHSDAGSRLAVTAAVKLALGFLDAGHDLATIDHDVAVGWVTAIRDRIAAEADRAGVPQRQMACTLLVTVVAAAQAVFVHVGDGANVTRDPSGSIAPVFWPKTGEYANSTYFVTEPDAPATLQFDRRAGTVDAVAVFTDGVQALALNYTDRSAHGPFFEPLFGLLRDAAEPSDLCVPFRAFLDSKAMNDRTDDDKTLVLAVRVPDRGD